MKKKLALLGSLGGVVGTSLVATLGGACCLGPAAVGLLGVNGAILAVELHAYRPVLLAGSLAFLALAFWFSRKPEGDCESGSCEARSQPPRLLWGATAITVSAFLLPRFLP